MTDENKQALEALERIRDSLNASMRSVAEMYMMKSVTKVEHDVEIEIINRLLKDVRTIRATLKSKPSVDGLVEALEMALKDYRHAWSIESITITTEKEVPLDVEGILKKARHHFHGSSIGADYGYKDVIDYLASQGHLNTKIKDNE